MTKDKMQKITTTELLNKLGLKSARTVRKWRDLGLIPDPELDNVADGRGRAAYWEPWVVDRCVKIRQLVTRGKNLTEIGELLEKDFSKAKRSYRSYSFQPK